VVTIFSVAIFSTSDSNIPKYLVGKKNDGKTKLKKKEKAFCKWYVIVSK
jgi:hypothetical protein